MFGFSSKVEVVEFISQDRYLDEQDDPLTLPEIKPAHLYLARLIVNPLGNKHFAADYFVKVTKKAGDSIKVQPLSPDGETIRRERKRTYTATSDGVLHVTSPLLAMAQLSALTNCPTPPLNTVEYLDERGYLPRHDLDFDESDFPAPDTSQKILTPDNPLKYPLHLVR